MTTPFFFATGHARHVRATARERRDEELERAALDGPARVDGAEGGHVLGHPAAMRLALGQLDAGHVEERVAADQRRVLLGAPAAHGRQRLAPQRPLVRRGNLGHRGADVGGVEELDVTRAMGGGKPLDALAIAFLLDGREAPDIVASKEGGGERVNRALPVPEADRPLQRLDGAGILGGERFGAGHGVDADAPARVDPDI
jgi:hypothetical protein